MVPNLLRRPGWGLASALLWPAEETVPGGDRQGHFPKAFMLRPAPRSPKPSASWRNGTPIQRSLNWKGRRQALRTEAMAASGHKRISSDIAIYVRYGSTSDSRDLPLPRLLSG